LPQVIHLVAELKFKARSLGPESLIFHDPPNTVPHNREADGEGASPATQSSQFPEGLLYRDTRWRPNTKHGSYPPLRMVRK
jgi:hypothetical protein